MHVGQGGGRRWNKFRIKIGQPEFVIARERILQTAATFDRFQHILNDEGPRLDIVQRFQSVPHDVRRLVFAEERQFFQRVHKEVVLLFLEGFLQGCVAGG